MHHEDDEIVFNNLDDDEDDDDEIEVTSSSSSYNKFSNQENNKHLKERLNDVSNHKILNIHNEGNKLELIKDQFENGKNVLTSNKWKNSYVVQSSFTNFPSGSSSLILSDNDEIGRESYVAKTCDANSDDADVDDNFENYEVEHSYNDDLLWKPFINK